jgi:hypothetical protein
MTSRRTACIRREVLLLALLLCLGLAGGLHAQATVVGKLVEAASGAPIPGALVRLLDASDTERAWSLSDSDGGFHLEGGIAEEYRIEVERIGFETWRSEVLSLPASGMLRRVFQVPIRPVVLSGIRVRGEARGECRARGSGTNALARVWIEVRKALELTARTADEPGDRFQLRRYDRDLDRGLRVDKATGSEGTKVGRATYRSVPVDTLIEVGFVAGTAGGEREFHAPDAPLLLSEAFGRTHCFRLVTGGDSATGDVGLAFRPTRDRTLPEIEGALWVDTATARLRSLTYHYVQMGEAYPDSLAHGRVEYRALPGGEWVVDRWWIRVPTIVERRQLRAQRRTPVGAYEATYGYEVARWQELGGELLEVATASRTLDTRHDGQIGGTVYDGAGGRPLAGAVVRIEGTELTRRTDARGSFLFAHVPPGRYRISADGVAGRPPATTTVDVAADGVEIVQLVPRPASHLAAASESAADGNEAVAPSAGKTGSRAADSLARRLRSSAGLTGGTSTASGPATGTLVGTVRAAESDQPIEGAVLEVVGSDLSTTTTKSGHFRLTGLGSGRVLVTARYLGYASDTATLQLQPGALTMADFHLAIQAIPVRELSVQIQRSIQNVQVQRFYERMERGAGGRYAGPETVAKYGLRGSLSRMPRVHISACRSPFGVERVYVVGCWEISLARSARTPAGLSDAGASCSPTFYVDGHRISKDGFMELVMSLPAEAVEGVEVHESSSVPPEYGGSAIGGCGVLMLWTHALAGDDRRGDGAGRGGTSPGNR